MEMSSASQIDVSALLSRHGQAVTEYLKKVLTRYPDAPQKLMESIEYSLMAGGKRLRPALVLESYSACSGEKGESLKREGDSSSQSAALAAAGAIELIHTFSLVHDDLPAMDDDDLRRGRPTNHKVYGEAMAILAGDSMVTMAFEILAADAEPGAARQLIRELAHASGPAGMIGGQVLDITNENQALTLEMLQQLHRMKTGALLTTSCRLGAMAAGADRVKLTAITDFGRHMGLAFQIVDDILDMTSTPEQLGKATNKDAARGKNTYPTLLGLDGSRAEASRQLDSALKALAPLGGAAAGLRSLAKFVVERHH